MTGRFMTIEIRGSVARPGVYEAAEGELFGEIIASRAGGLRGAAPLKALLPGGALSVPLDCGEAMSARLKAACVEALGSSLGEGPLIVISGDECIVRAMQRTASRLSSECCCERPSCARAAAWISAVLARLESGEARSGDVSLLERAAFALEQCAGCAGASALSRSVAASAAKFRGEMMRHERAGGCGRIGCGDICAW